MPKPRKRYNIVTNKPQQGGRLRKYFPMVVRTPKFQALLTFYRGKVYSSPRLLQFMSNWTYQRVEEYAKVQGWQVADVPPYQASRAEQIEIPASALTTR
jgi:hypothetical protein